MLAGALALGLFLPTLLPGRSHAQTPGPHPYVEYDLSHTDELGSGNLVTVTDTNPGEVPGPSDDPNTILVTGGLTSPHGDHDLTVEATIVPLANNAVRLQGRGEHLFTLTGTNASSDVWRAVDNRMLARAQIVDDLTISGVPTATATIELYWQVAGRSDAVIDIAQPGDLFYDFSTNVTLEGTTTTPNTGGGSENRLVRWGGYLNGDLDDSKFLDEQIVMSFDIDPSVGFHFEASFEVAPHTSLNNGVEFPGTLYADGVHRSDYYDVGAELVGVVVRDENGDIVENALVVPASTFYYPVLDEVPPPRIPEKTILSPIAVIANDLGEYSASYGVDKMLDHSGLTVPFTSGVTGFDAYISGVATPYATKQGTVSWVSQVDTSLPLQGTVDFDLGASYLVDRLALWSVSLENVTIFVAEELAGPWTEVGQYTLPNNHYWFDSYPESVVDFGAEYTARYVRLQIDSAYPYSTSDTFAYATVGEIAASAEIIVPEPGLPLSLAIAGGVLAAGQRRRRIHSTRLATDRPA